MLLSTSPWATWLGNYGPLVFNLTRVAQLAVGRRALLFSAGSGDGSVP